MAKSRVSIARCTDYSEISVLKAVKGAVDLLGGMDAFVKGGGSSVNQAQPPIGKGPG